MEDCIQVELLESLPQKNLEEAIVLAARISFDKELTTKERDDKLIKYLYRNHHTSPFEMVRFKFRIKCPIFVARQILRHRTANVNEFSARYALVPEEMGFYHPSKFEDGIRLDSKVNKQSSTIETISPDIKNKVKEIESKLESIFADYHELVKLGVAKEVARFCLPVSTYTQFLFCLDLHNLLKFLKLRMDPHTQLETRKVANKIFELIKDLVPVTISCFLEEQDKITLTKKEIQGLIDNNRELEFDSLSQKMRYLELFEDK